MGNLKLKLNKAIINSVNFVWNSKNVISTLLLPLSYITKAVVKRKTSTYKAGKSWHPNIPVIVVGNIYVGGTGKTPVVIELVKHLQRNGYTPAVISRGYGVKSNKEAMIGAHPLNPKLFGDEPSLIAQETGAVISVHPERIKAAQALLDRNKSITEGKINVMVMDDGLQHLKIDRDIEIIVQDARGIGNGRLLPAGPLREPADKLKDVDIIINNGLFNDTSKFEGLTQHSDSLLSKSKINSETISKPINAYMDLYAYEVIHLNSNKCMDWQSWLTENEHKQISALAGIGNPSRFFNMLKKDLKNITNLYPLADHAKIDTGSFKNVANDIVLITSKDAIKCKHVKDERIWIVKAKPQFNSDLWLQYILNKLNNWKHHAS